ncbi:MULTISPECIES: hypothetical protein [unclassified Azospirillum]|uniref:hypothetical protein n=1 Tax=unclassified Azospirillum TaxID=2630922 RepID=UPI001178BB36|nr:MULTISPECIES: hypothetical protein [unclassified Azospirillum]
MAAGQWAVGLRRYHMGNTINSGGENSMTVPKIVMPETKKGEGGSTAFPQFRAQNRPSDQAG